MSFEEKFKYIKKCKNPKTLEYQERARNYISKTLLEIKKIKKIYKYNQIHEAHELKEMSGVYLIFLENIDGVIFTYIGESADIYKRWNQHIKSIPKSSDSLYKKIRNHFKKTGFGIEDINFVILEKNLIDQNKRLLRETYNIFKFKAGRSISLNNKNCSRRLRCPDGHGFCRAWLSYKILDNGEFKLCVMGKSRNKDCKDQFEIK